MTESHLPTTFMWWVDDTKASRTMNYNNKILKRIYKKTAYFDQKFERDDVKLGDVTLNQIRQILLIDLEKDESRYSLDNEIMCDIVPLICLIDNDYIQSSIFLGLKIIKRQQDAEVEESTTQKQEINIQKQENTVQKHL